MLQFFQEHLYVRVLMGYVYPASSFHSIISRANVQVYAIQQFLRGRQGSVAEMGPTYSNLLLFYCLRIYWELGGSSVECCKIVRVWVQFLESMFKETRQNKCGHTSNPSTGKVRQMGVWSSLASQSRPVDDPQIPGRDYCPNKTNCVWSGMAWYWPLGFESTHEYVYLPTCETHPHNFMGSGWCNRLNWSIIG